MHCFGWVLYAIFVTLKQMKNKTKIQITGTRLSPESLKVRCEKVYGLRTANKVNDIEVVNQTVLGKLKENSLDIQFKIIV